MAAKQSLPNSRTNGADTDAQLNNARAACIARMLHACSAKRRSLHNCWNCASSMHIRGGRGNVDAAEDIDALAGDAVTAAKNNATAASSNVHDFSASSDWHSEKMV